MGDKYDTIRELDKERNGCSGLHKTSIEDYMIPPPFWELGGSPIKMEHIRNYIVTSTRLPNKFLHQRVCEVCK